MRTLQPAPRQLTAEEIELVSGGYSGETIVVTGYRLSTSGSTTYFVGYEDADSGVQPHPTLTPADEGSGGGEVAQEPRETPCVETMLESGVSIADANRAALAASNAISALNDETYEYSSIVWTLNGQVGFTAPYTDNLVDQVNWMGGLRGVPSGAIIIGIVHNHPDVSGINDRYPSGAWREDGDDWMSYDQLVNWNRDHSDADDIPRGITVDGNMLLYIYTNETSKTYVYDKTDKNQTRESCSLQ